MDKISKFDENFLEDKKYVLKEEKDDLNKVLSELHGNNMCFKEKKTYLNCIQEKKGICINFKDSLIICLKNNGKLI